MRITENGKVKAAVAVVVVAVLTVAIGVAVSAHMATRQGQGGGQDPAGQGVRHGAGMMGQGMMGPGPGMRGGPGGGPLGMIGPELRALDLTDAQHQQVRQILAAHQDEIKSIGDRMTTARRALNDAITADTFDEGAIRAKAAEVSAVDADRAVLHARVHAAVFAVLTPDQVKKAKELRGQMENRMKEGPRHMRQHGDQTAEPRVEEGISLPETV